MQTLQYSVLLHDRAQPSLICNAKSFHIALSPEKRWVRRFSIQREFVDVITVVNFVGQVARRNRPAQRKYYSHVFKVCPCPDAFELISNVFVGLFPRPVLRVSMPLEEISRDLVTQQCADVN